MVVTTGATSRAKLQSNHHHQQTNILPEGYIDNKHQLKGSVKEPNILIYFFFPPITQSCSVSDVLFTGRRGVSDVSALKNY